MSRLQKQKSQSKPTQTEQDNDSPDTKLAFLTTKFELQPPWPERTTHKTATVLSWATSAILWQKFETGRYQAGASYQWSMFWYSIQSRCLLPARLAIPAMCPSSLAKQSMLEMVCRLAKTCYSRVLGIPAKQAISQACFCQVRSTTQALDYALHACNNPVPQSIPCTSKKQVH